MRDYPYIESGMVNGQQNWQGDNPSAGGDWLTRSAQTLSQFSGLQDYLDAVKELQNNPGSHWQTRGPATDKATSDFLMGLMPTMALSPEITAAFKAAYPALKAQRGGLSSVGLVDTYNAVKQYFADILGFQNYLKDMRKEGLAEFVPHSRTQPLTDAEKSIFFDVPYDGTIGYWRPTERFHK